MQDGKRYRRPDLQCVKMDSTVLRIRTSVIAYKEGNESLRSVTVPPFHNTLNAILSTLKFPHSSTFNNAAVPRNRKHLGSGTK